NLDAANVKTTLASSIPINTLERKRQTLTEFLERLNKQKQNYVNMLSGLTKERDALVAAALPAPAPVNPRIAQLNNRLVDIGNKITNIDNQINQINNLGGVPIGPSELKTTGELDRTIESQTKLVE